jgi:hypothetical protein
MSFEKPSADGSVDPGRETANKGFLDTSSTGEKPYFGMTGTQLNIWVTVACTTAMTLFGEGLAIPRPYFLIS